MATAARALIGCRFRLHGRGSATGLDCVGLVLAAHGRRGGAPYGYAMRGGSAGHWSAMLTGAGLAPTDWPRAGDVALVEAGPVQFHLAILTATGFVHADAALRRVVEQPGMLPWPVIGFWREE